MDTEIQRFIDQFKKTFVYEMLSQTLTDEQLFSHSIQDNGVIWFKEQMRQMWAIWLAGKGNKSNFVVLNCDQLQQALGFGAPALLNKFDRTDSDINFQLETEMTIEFIQDGHSGAGYYCWYLDLPEEGSIFLTDSVQAQGE